MKLFDAHRHLLIDESKPVVAVVNGTSPEDWGPACEAPYAAIGLHPQKIAEAACDWRERFLEHIGSAQAVGEIGLDGLCGVDMELQLETFRWQLKQSAVNNMPVSIHCLKASDLLLRVLKEAPPPERGFHLHAYAGSAEQVPLLVKLGGYFSFHAGQLDGNARKAPKAIQAVPAARLLIETDAQQDSTKDGEGYEDYLQRGYILAAQLRRESLESFRVQVAENFERYFLDE